MASWRAQLDAVGSDRLSGARDILSAAAQVIQAYAKGESPSSVDGLCEDLTTITRALLSAQPAMASLLHLLNAAWGIVAVASSLEEAQEGLHAAAIGFADDVKRAGPLIASNALEVLRSRPCVATISASSTVFAALSLAHQSRVRLDVHCLESRPMLEGRGFAQRLAELGIDVTLTVDAAGHDVIREADVLLVGVDSLTSSGVIGKVGTAAVALLAQGHAVPVYALADASKMWPDALGPPRIRNRESGEVWADAPQGVRVLNRYFDVADAAHFSGIVSEKGIESPEMTVANAKTLDVHPRLIATYREIGAGLS